MKAREIKDIRRACDMTQEQFARALCVSSAQTVYFWERGTYKPSLIHEIILHRMAQLINSKRAKDVKDALNGAQFMRPVPEDEAALGSVDLEQFGIGFLLYALFGKK